MKKLTWKNNPDPRQILNNIESIDFFLHHNVSNMIIIPAHQKINLVKRGNCQMISVKYFQLRNNLLVKIFLGQFNSPGI